MELKPTNILKEAFVTWMWKPMKYYQKFDPTLENLLIAPDSNLIFAMSENIQTVWLKEMKSKNPQFSRVIFECTYKQYFISVVILCISQVLTILQSILIMYMVEYLYNQNSTVREAVALILIFIISNFVILLTRGISSYRSLLLAGQIKGALSLLITKKLLNLSNSTLSSQDFSGKIFNTLNTDFEIFELIHFSLYIWSLPVIISISIAIIYIYFSGLALIGIGITVLHLPLIEFISNISSKYRSNADIIGDKRVVLIERLIYGMRLMKFYSWEKLFYKKISKQRRDEVNERITAGYLGGVLLVLADFSMIMILFITLLVTIYNKEQFSTSQYTFLSTVLHNTHITICLHCTYGFSTLHSLLRLFNRIGQILLTHEFELNSDEILKLDTFKQYSIKIKNLYVPERSLNSESSSSKVIPVDSRSLVTEISHNIISNISFKLMKDEIILLTGGIGAGKSVLLQSLINEFHHVSSCFRIRGQISFLSSTPWLIAGTVRENILMGRPFDSDFYNEILKSCALIQDLNLFELQDQHEVGDQGCILSGGQKARICLARVLYSRADIYLLDDPLSALDNSVANHIFVNCFKVLCRGKSLLIATHQTHFSKYADKIINMKDGAIDFFGQAHQIENFKSPKPRKVIPEIENKKDYIYIDKSKDESHYNLKFSAVWIYLKFAFKNLPAFCIFLVYFIFAQGVYQSCYYFQVQWSELDTKESSYYLYICGFLILACLIVFTIRVYVVIGHLLISSEKIHNKALKSLTCTSLSFFNNNPAGILLNRFTKDIGVVDGPLQVNFFECFLNGMFMIEIVIISAYTIYYSVLIIPVWILGMWYILKSTMKAVIKLKNIEINCKGEILSTITSVINGITTIRSLSLGGKFKKDMTKLVTNHYNSYFTLQSLIRFTQFYADLISFILASFNVTLILILKNLIEPSLATYCLITCFTSLGLAFYFTKDILELSSSMSSVNRLIQYTNLPAEQNTHKLNYKFTSGSIVFSNISMKYEPELPNVLNNFDLSITSGHKIGIVGRTGAGKSSIIQILFRLVNPTTGTIYIDGQDYQMIDLPVLRSQISIIPQSSTLFAVSVRENIDPSGTQTDQNIWDALKLVGLDVVVSKSKNKLDSIIGDGQIELSDGQAQLLCFTRILIKKNLIVVMDEATSNVDEETDQVIQSAVKVRFDKCTMIVIAHRLQSIIDSDMICVMDSGRCQEYGPHEDLINRKGSIYQELVKNSIKK